MSTQLSALTFYLLLTGCTQTDIRRGVPLHVRDVEHITVGTSKIDVLKTLGPPTAMETVPGGSRFKYAFRTTKVDDVSLSFFQASFSWQAEDHRIQEVWLRFDRSGRVTEKSHPRPIRTVR